jgi:ParD-like antitoxin of type II ParDE toxin-antitoxin system
MNDHQPRRLARHQDAKSGALGRRLVDGEKSGDAGPLDLREIEREARQAALDRLRRAVAESEASGEAVPFDMETWLEEQDRLDSAA